MTARTDNFESLTTPQYVPASLHEMQLRDYLRKPHERNKPMADSDDIEGWSDEKLAQQAAALPQKILEAREELVQAKAKQEIARRAADNARANLDDLQGAYERLCEQMAERHKRLTRL